MQFNVKQYILFTITTLFWIGLVYDSGANFNQCINSFYDITGQEHILDHFFCSLKVIMDIFSICFVVNTICGCGYFLYSTFQ
jgi:hypothetical protein